MNLDRNHFQSNEEQDLNKLQCKIKYKQKCYRITNFRSCVPLLYQCIKLIHFHYVLSFLCTSNKWEILCNKKVWKCWNSLWYISSNVWIHCYKNQTTFPLDRPLFARPTLGGTKDEHFSCFHSSCQWGITNFNKNLFITQSTFGLGGVLFLCPKSHLNSSATHSAPFSMRRLRSLRRTRVILQNVNLNRFVDISCSTHLYFENYRPIFQCSYYGFWFSVFCVFPSQKHTLLLETVRRKIT